MKISVVMTLYNGEQYLLPQLESILQQTRKVDEVIICDDGSKDSSVQMLEEFIEKNELSPAWKLHINEKNLGYANNFINGMSYVTGDVVFFADQDDVWMAEKVEKSMAVMEKNPAIDLLCSEFEVLTCSDDAPTIQKFFLQYMNGSGEVEQLHLNEKTIFIGSEGCVMCFRRTFFEEIKGYHFDGWAHDEFLWKLAMAKGTCYYYHKPLIQRRMHSGNVSKRKMRDLQKRILFLENLKRGHEKMLELGKVTGLSDADVKLIEKNIRSVDLRIALLAEKKYFNTLKLLLFYSKNYHSRRAIPVELLMAMKG